MRNLWKIGVCDSPIKSYQSTRCLMVYVQSLFIIIAVLSRTITVCWNNVFFRRKKRSFGLILWGNCILIDPFLDLSAVWLSDSRYLNAACDLRLLRLRKRFIALHLVNRWSRAFTLLRSRYGLIDNRESLSMQSKIQRASQTKNGSLWAMRYTCAFWPLMIVPNTICGLRYCTLWTTEPPHICQKETSSAGTFRSNIAVSPLNKFFLPTQVSDAESEALREAESGSTVFNSMIVSFFSKSEIAVVKLENGSSR